VPKLSDRSNFTPISSIYDATKPDTTSLMGFSVHR